MARTIYAGIDIGTHQVKVVIAAPADNPDAPMQILGSGSASSKGMRHGYIMDVAETTKSIREALGRARASSKVPVTRARVGVGGVGLEEIRTNGVISLTAFGGTVTEQAIERASREAEKQATTKLVNRTVIHAIPLSYKIDGQQVLGQPISLQGTKLSVEVLLITMLTQHHDDLVEAVEAAGVEVDGVMAAPLAASLVALTKSQKMAGVVLANIGAETLSIVVYDDNLPVSVKVFPTGGADITNQIALSFQLPLNEAEQLKRGAVIGSNVPAKKMDLIIASQLKEMFTLVNAHLKEIGRQRLLPAGIVITGGGSGLASATDIAKAVLKLPAQISQIGLLARASSVDATWAVAYGLCRWAYAEDKMGRTSTIGEVFSGGWESLKKGFRSLLP